MKPSSLLWAIVGAGLLLLPSAASADDWIFTNTQAIPTTNSAGIFVRTGRERVVTKVHVAANIGGRIVATYDSRVIPQSLNTNGMSAKEMFQAMEASTDPFTAGYFRGKVDLAELDGKSRERTGRTFPQWVSAFASGDRRKLVIAWDEGPISVSTNFGTSWRTITALGQYDFTLSETPKGSAMFAKVSLGAAQDAVISRVAGIVNSSSWYLAATAADGTRMVVAGGALESPPALAIAPSGTNLVFSWSVECHGFILQRSAQSGTTGSWVDVTNAVNTVNGSFQVKLPSSAETGIFRLQRR